MYYIFISIINEIIFGHINSHHIDILFHIIIYYTFNDIILSLKDSRDRIFAFKDNI